MPTVKTRTFRSGNSEAVRLPKDMAFGPDVELTMVRSGDVLTLFPTKGGLQDLLRRLDAMPGPDAVEVRETDLPERPGL